jgi:hypothetical protein
MWPRQKYCRSQQVSQSHTTTRNSMFTSECVEFTESQESLQQDLERNNREHALSLVKEVKEKMEMDENEQAKEVLANMGWTTMFDRHGSSCISLAIEYGMFALAYEMLQLVNFTLSSKKRTSQSFIQTSYHCHVTQWKHLVEREDPILKETPVGLALRLGQYELASLLLDAHEQFLAKDHFMNDEMYHHFCSRTLGLLSQVQRDLEAHRGEARKPCAEEAAAAAPLPHKFRVGLLNVNQDMPEENSLQVSLIEMSTSLTKRQRMIHELHVELVKRDMDMAAVTTVGTKPDVKRNIDEFPFLPPPLPITILGFPRMVSKTKSNYCKS